MEHDEQAGKIGMSRRRLTAGHRAPERDRVPIHHDRLVDLLARADGREARRGQLVDRVLAEPQQLRAVTCPGLPSRTRHREWEEPPMTRTPQRHRARDQGFPPRPTRVKGRSGAITIRLGRRWLSTQFGTKQAVLKRWLA